MYIDVHNNEPSGKSVYKRVNKIVEVESIAITHPPPMIDVCVKLCEIVGFSIAIIRDVELESQKSDLM